MSEDGDRSEAERVLAESLQDTEQLSVVVAELERQLVGRADEMARIKADCDHAATLATFAREECESLRSRLTSAEAEVKRLTAEVVKWKS